MKGDMSPLLCAMRVGPSNCAAFTDALRASIHLDGQLQAPLLLGLDEGFEPSEPLLATAREAFSDVLTVHFPAPPNGKWPIPQNIVWQQTARWLHAQPSISSTHWLWWESDACPIRSWFTTLQNAISSTIFLGVPCKAPDDTLYMNGVGLWPIRSLDLLADTAAFYCRETPFDIAARFASMRSFTNLSHLILHQRKMYGGALASIYSSSQFKTLLANNPEACFLHGCQPSNILAHHKGHYIKDIEPQPRSDFVPTFTISVLCHNQAHITKACLDSILEFSGTDYELFVVDNASTDTTASLLKSIQPNFEGRMHIITNSTNQGFQEPNERILTLAKGSYLVLLNNDVVVSHGWLKALQAPFLASLQVALTGIKNTCSVVGSDLKGRPAYPGEPMEYVEASCLMGRIDLLRRHGLFAPYLSFAYYEDLDLSLRLREAGFKIEAVNLPIHHNNRGSTSCNLNLSSIIEANREAIKTRWRFYIQRRRFDRRVLVRRDGARGDVLFATAVLAALKSKWPSATIHFETKCLDFVPLSLATPCLKANPFDFDTVYDLNLSYERKPCIHILDAYAEACELWMPFTRRLYVDFNNADMEWARKVTGFKPTIVIHCGPTGWKGRDWPFERFDELAVKLRRQYWNLVFVGSSSNYAPSNATRLDTTLSQLYALMRCASLFIGVDSLPFNVAQAANIPCIGLFGSIDPQYRLLGKPWQIGLQASVSIAPCVGLHHRLTPPVTFSQCDGVCMDAISVKEVLKAVPRAFSARVSR